MQVNITLKYEEVRAARFVYDKCVRTGVDRVANGETFDEWFINVITHDANMGIRPSLDGLVKYAKSEKSWLQEAAEIPVLHPSELTVNIDSEKMSADFSQNMTPRKMFPGVYDKMDQIFDERKGK